MNKNNNNLTAADFVHLHVHSHYSLLDGVGKVPDIVRRAKELGMEAVALTDHGTMYGIVEFFEEAKKIGIKPILGLEGYLAPRRMTDKTPRIDSDNRHLTFLAKNIDGYKNLIKITSAGHLQGYYYKPRVDFDFLAEHASGLVCLSGCANGPVAHAFINNNEKGAREYAQRLLDIFGEDFYLELQYHQAMADQEKANRGMKKLAAEMKIPLVATSDLHYIYPEDNAVQDVLVCIQTGRLLSDKDRMSFMEYDLSMTEPARMMEIFADVPEAITNTKKIADKCEVKLDLGNYYLPKVAKPTGFTDDYDYLDWLTIKGMVERYGDIQLVKNEDFDRVKVLSTLDRELVERMKYELGVIKKMGFPSYFVIVWDFVRFARENDIMVGPGRGSGAGSIVLYALKITDLCPIEYGLLFERFMNPDRISLPDIDLDFADDKRGEVLKYVGEKYGEDKVAQIITFGTMKARVAVRDVGRVMGFSYADVDKLAKMIDPKGTLRNSLEQVQELKAVYDSDPAVHKLIDMSMKLEGVARHFGMHACGVVISPTALTDFVPLQEATKGDTKMLSQYSLHPVEAVGLVKMDFLGLANLTIMKNAIRIIRKVYDQEVDLDNIPLDDQKTFDMLSDGLSTGVFQLESQGMKKYLKRLRPRKLEDVIAMAALYRPGPLNSGMTDEFIDRKNGLKEVKYLHPSMENALQDTYGVIIYQEQVMQLSKDMAGFTGGQADTIRKAVGKKIADLMEKMGQEFKAGCLKNGISEEIAAQVMDDMAKFAEYGFNKAHSTCYGVISYRTAWLKANFSPAYMAAVLTSEQNDTDKLTIVIEECARMGIEVLPPDINKSFVEFGVEKDTKNIRYALAAIKNVGAGISTEVVEERKKNGDYKNLADFITRTVPFGLNRKTLESLIKAGALDEFGNRASMMNAIEMILAFGRDTGRIRALGQTNIFGQLNGNAAGVEEEMLLEIPRLEEVSKKELLAWEKELMGMYLSDHPLGEYKNYLLKYTESCRQLTLDMEGEKKIVGGVITKVQKIVTKKGEAMAFVAIEDLSGLVEVLVFPKLFSKDQELWREGKIVLIEGVISTKDGQVKILGNKAKEISLAEAEAVTDDQLPVAKLESADNELLIKVPNYCTRDDLQTLYDMLKQHDGRVKVNFQVIVQGKPVKIRSNLKVDLTPELKNRAYSLLNHNS
ncbi:MAG: DNA polymerase III subunit alpha [Patescibacteria group bacterium]